MNEKDLKELSNEQIFDLRNLVVAESSKRVAAIEFKERLTNLITETGISQVEADDAYSSVKSEVYKEEQS